MNVILNPRMITRTRPISVCEFCRDRKIKCDKGKPCSNCMKYGNGTCTYSVKESFNTNPFEQPLVQQLHGVRKRISVLLKKANDKNTRDLVLQLESQLNVLLANKNVPLIGIEPDIKTEAKNEETSPYEEAELSNNSSMSNPSSSMSNPSTGNSTISNGSRLSTNRINFFDQYEAVTSNGLLSVNHYPFGGMSLLGIDYIFSPIYMKTFKSLNYKGKEELVRGLKPSIRPDTEQLFMNKFFEDESLEDFKSIHNVANSGVKPKITPLGFMNVDENLNEDQLIAKIESALPTNRIIKILLNKFFDQLYPFFPFIDVNEFKTDIYRILKINTENEDLFMKPSLVTISAKFDVSKLGILLIILKLSYVSIFSSNHKINRSLIDLIEDENIKILLKNPIDFHVIQVAQLCLTQFNPLNSVDFEVLQLGVFMRYYLLCGPEYGVGTEVLEPLSFTTMLLSMCYSLGFNRERNRFINPMDAKIFNIGRRIWYHLLYIDVVTYFIIGTPTELDKFSYSVKVPTNRGNHPNGRIEQLSNLIIEGFATLLGTCSKLASITGKVTGTFDIDEFKGLTIDGYQKVLEQLTTLNLEGLNQSADGALNKDVSGEIEDQNDYITSLAIMRNCFLTSNITIASFCHFYIHFTQVEDSSRAMNELWKISCLLYLDLTISLHNFFHNNLGNLGKSATFIVLPYVVLLIQKILLKNLILVSRVRILLEHKDEIDKEFHQNLTKYYKNLILSSKLFLKLLSNVVDICFFAWRMYQFQGFFLLQIITPDNFTKLLEENQEQFGIRYAEIIDSMKRTKFGFDNSTVEKLNLVMVACFTQLGVDPSEINAPLDDIDVDHIWDNIGNTESYEEFVNCKDLVKRNKIAKFFTNGSLHQEMDNWKKVRQMFT